MRKSLAEITSPIEPELKQFQRQFREALKSKAPLLDRITMYIVRRKGKQMRPMFIFLSAKLFGEATPSSFRAASLVELLHTATLVHDDVVDESLERRGFFSVNALWKNKAAVLVGDYLLSRGLLLALDNQEFRMLQIVSQAVREMSEGEMLQMEKARRLDIREEVYFEIIRQKTASLIAASCAAGAASVTQDEEAIEKMRQFGEHLGIAFQIRDDLFDFGDGDAGKPQGNDLQEKKMTLPLIYALQKADAAKRRHLIDLIKNHNTEPERIREVSHYVLQSGGIEYAREAMYTWRDKAVEILRTFPENRARTALEELIEYVTERKK
jgi:octaprenyl-diphosphate synthase